MKKFHLPTRPKLLVLGALLAMVALCALLLLALLAVAAANTEFFDRYYSWLYAANAAVALILTLIVGGLAAALIVRLRQGRFGTRLLAKLAVFFTLVGVLPGSLIYLISLQFVARSIESWFDVNIEAALESGLELGRAALDAELAELRREGVRIAARLSALGRIHSAALERLRARSGAQQAMVVSQTGRVLARAPALDADHLGQEIPTRAMLQISARAGGDAIVEDMGKNARTQNALRLRVLIPFPAHGEKFLQLMRTVPAPLARNMQEAQRAWRDYQIKKLGRTGLRKMYIGTLTLALFFASFLAMILALVLGNQLTRPLFLLAQGTREVARGDYTPKREIRSKDELGFLTQSFNAMTRQLSDARAAVERNRNALEQAKAYLESVLANLSAGVFVFDRQFRLNIANAGAQRILRQSFQPQLSRLLDEITGLNAFGALVRKAFAERAAADADAFADPDHWQHQLEVRVAGETEPLTLLVRGARLLRAPSGAARHSLTSGYVVVFDDISDVISAQRSIAWGEVARRLAHEIKNPLTPIQLSAERLQMKLMHKLDANDAAMLKRCATTIIRQVAAMKRMVDDFREYARMPTPALQNLQLNDLVTEVLTLYGAGEGKSEIHFDLKPLPVMRGDPNQLRQVIHNLLQNAQDAVAQRPRKWVLIETQTVRLEPSDAETNQSGHVPQAVRLSISDNGPGFPAHLLARAFEPYVTSKSKGTGLGLATVKKIVDEHGARIEIRNDVRDDGTVSGAQISILFFLVS
ncbi:putative two-component sensor kinase [Candidatus Glomeribacter gigasporarum BEG34]|uniref:histidine kinase n=2 Tax=Candidatus Glomeribacter gigasporarum TaxID=132144 RepID=G2J9Y7_9BURK|nr:putative two-component sensor kinase [Candidatus Glomeribacter gigasporarum BEG34]